MRSLLSAVTTVALVLALGACERPASEPRQLAVAEAALTQQLDSLRDGSVDRCWVLKSAEVGWIAEASKPGLLFGRQVAFLRYVEILAGIDMSSATLRRAQDPAGRWYLEVTLAEPVICGVRTPNRERQLWPDDEVARFDVRKSGDRELLEALDRQRMEQQLREQYEARLKQFVRQRAQEKLQLTGARADVRVEVRFGPSGPVSLPASR